MGVGFIRDGRSRCRFHERREGLFFVFVFETGRLGVGFMKDEIFLILFLRQEGWVWVS